MDKIEKWKKIIDIAQIKTNINSVVDLCEKLSNDNINLFALNLKIISKLNLKEGNLLSTNVDYTDCHNIRIEYFDFNDFLHTNVDITLMIQNLFVEDIVKKINIELDKDKNNIILINNLVMFESDIERVSDKFYEIKYKTNYKIISNRKIKLDSL
jgi:hypothetical protein